MNKGQRAVTGANPCTDYTLGGPKGPFQGLFGHSLNLVVIDFIVRHMGWPTICIQDIPLPALYSGKILHELAEWGMLLEEDRPGGDPVYHPNPCSKMLYSLYLVHCSIRDDSTGSDTMNQVLSSHFHYLPSNTSHFPEPGAC